MKTRIKEYVIIISFSLGYLLGYATVFWTSSYSHERFVYNTNPIQGLRNVHNALERSEKDRDCGESSLVQPKMNTYSYILVLYYFEQMNNAMKNLLHLGPVAMNLDLKIVEPFVVHSRLYGLPGMLPSGEVTGKFYTLRTLFNIDSVNQSLYSYANATMAPFEEFIFNAPRDIVVVYFIHKEHFRPRTFRLQYQYSRILKLVSEKLKFH